MITNIRPTVDYAFKRIFGVVPNISVTIDILRAVLTRPPIRSIIDLEIVNPFNERETADDKLSVLDVKARDQTGRLYNIEMQTLATEKYPRRALYYWSRIFAGQLSKGDRYPKLQPTISISFVDGTLFPEKPDYHLDFQLRNLEHPQMVFCDLLDMHLIELPKFKKTLEELTSPLDEWVYFLKHGSELDPDKLPAKLTSPAVSQAMEVLKMISQSELERERYLAREKFERDELSREEEYRRITEESRDAGERGEMRGRIYAYQRLLSLPLTSKDELAALSLDELKALAEALEQRLASPGT